MLMAVFYEMLMVVFFDSIPLIQKGIQVYEILLCPANYCVLNLFCSERESDTRKSRFHMISCSHLVVYISCLINGKIQIHCQRHFSH